MVQLSSERLAFGALVGSFAAIQAKAQNEKTKILSSLAASFRSSQPRIVMNIPNPWKNLKLKRADNRSAHGVGHALRTQIVPKRQIIQRAPVAIEGKEGK